MFIARVIEYEVWGNETDGFDVNNLFEVAKIKLNGDFRKLTDKQIMKRLSGKRGRNVWSPYNLNAPTYLGFDLRKVEPDNSICSEDRIEVIDRKTGAPVGRIELSDMEEEK